MILLMTILYLHTMLAISCGENIVLRNVTIDRKTPGALRRASTLRTFRLKNTHAAISVASVTPGALRQYSTTKRTSQQQSRLKNKALDLMRQAMYTAQEHLWQAEKILVIYQNATPYRMAYIFMKLEQMTHESATIIKYLDSTRRGSVKISVTQRLQVYWQLVRRNMDATYLVDYVRQLVPQDKMSSLREWVARKEKEDMQRKLRLGQNSVG